MDGFSDSSVAVLPCPSETYQRTNNEREKFKNCGMAIYVVQTVDSNTETHLGSNLHARIAYFFQYRHLDIEPWNNTAIDLQPCAEDSHDENAWVYPLRFMH